MNLVKEKQGGLVPTGLKRWPFKLIKHFADATGVSNEIWRFLSKHVTRLALNKKKLRTIAIAWRYKVIKKNFYSVLILHLLKLLFSEFHAFQALSTGQPRYLKVQGNGENTSSYPKFDIAKM